MRWLIPVVIILATCRHIDRYNEIEKPHTISSQKWEIKNDNQNYYFCRPQIKRLYCWGINAQKSIDVPVKITIKTPHKSITGEVYTATVIVSGLKHDKKYKAVVDAEAIVILDKNVHYISSRQNVFRVQYKSHTCGTGRLIVKVYQVN
jgi:hypothetical protein